MATPRRRPPAKVKAWSEWARPPEFPPAPPLWDCIDSSGHIHGPYSTRQAAQDEADRRNQASGRALP